MYLDNLKKTSGWSRTVSVWSGKFPDNLESFWTILCIKSCKTTFDAHLSRIWKFTRFIRKVLATKILLTGKFSLFVTLGIGLANCPALFLSYFSLCHGFVMKYSWQIQRSKWTIQVDWVEQFTRIGWDWDGHTAPTSVRRISQSSLIRIILFWRQLLVSLQMPSSKTSLSWKGKFRLISSTL